MTDPNQNTDPAAAGHEDTWGATPAFKAAWADAHPAPERTDAEELPAPAQSEAGPTYETPNA